MFRRLIHLILLSLILQGCGTGLRYAGDIAVLVNDLAFVEQGNSISVDVLINDVSFGQAISVHSVDTPSNGTASVVSGERISYSPNGGFSGQDTFIYRVQDSNGQFLSARVTVAVYPTPAGFTWTGEGGDNDWSNGANWLGGSVPNPGDAVVLSGRCGSPCAIDVDQNINLSSVQLHASFFGTVTQQSGSAITVGTTGWSQASGTFVGGSDTIDIDGPLQVSGGTFTSTSGTLEVGRDGAQVAQTSFSLSPGTVFNHNNGTVRFNTWVNSGAPAHTIDVDSSVTFNNVVVDGFSNCCNETILTVASGDVAIVEGNLTHLDGRLGGRWDLHGNLIVDAAADGGVTGANSSIRFIGDKAQTYTYAAGGGTAPIAMDTSGTVAPAGGTTALKVYGVTLTRGTFTAPTGNLEIGRTDARESYTSLSVSANATFVHNNGGLRFVSNAAVGNSTHSVEPGSALFYDVEIAADQTCCTRTTISVASGQTLNMANALTLTSGAVSGSWNLQGNISVSATFDGGNATLRFSGTNQNYNNAGGDEPDGIYTVAPGTTLTMQTNMNVNAGGQNITVDNGTLDRNGFTVNGTINLINGGMVIN